MASRLKSADAAFREKFGLNVSVGPFVRRASTRTHSLVNIRPQSSRSFIASGQPRKRKGHNMIKLNRYKGYKWALQPNNLWLPSLSLSFPLVLVRTSHITNELLNSLVTFIGRRASSCNDVSHDREVRSDILRQPCNEAQLRDEGNQSFLSLNINNTQRQITKSESKRDLKKLGLYWI